MKRNKSIALILLLTMLLTLWTPVTGFGAVTPAYEEDFNSAALGAFPVSAGKPSENWTTEVSGLTATIKEKGAGDRYLHLIGTGTDKKAVSSPKISLLEYGAPLTGNDLVVSFRMNVEALHESPLAVVRTEAGNVPINLDFRVNKEDDSAYLVHYKQGPITTQNQWGQSVNWGVTLKKGTWYKFVFTADTDSSKFNIYIADNDNRLIAKKENIEVRYDIAATNEKVNLNTLEFGNFYAGNTFNIDDIYFANDPDYELPIETQPTASAGASQPPVVTGEPVTSSAAVSTAPGTVVIDDGADGYTQYSSGNININSENFRPTLDLISYNGTLRDFNPGTAGQYAQYAPRLTGEYDIYLYAAWANLKAFTEDVTLTVSSAGGTENWKLNQRQEAPRQWTASKDADSVSAMVGTWLKLGTYQLNPASFVKYTNNQSGADRRMIADAVAFVPKGLSKPADVYDYENPPSPSPSPSPLPSTAPLGEKIVINSLEGYTESGTWTISGLMTHDGVTPSKYTSTTGAWARFNPGIEPIDAGKYRVYYYNIYNDNQISYTGRVRASGSDHDLQYPIEKTSSPKWTLVGEYTFDGNGDEYFEIAGAGKNYARATSVKFELVEAAVKYPIGSAVTLSGNFAVGSRVSLHYQYLDRSDDPESGSTYTLYSASLPDAAEWNKIAEGSCGAELINEVEIPASAENQYIKIGVTPKNANPEDADKSEEVFSEVYGPIVSGQFRPTAENVIIEGEAETGNTLTASYTYKDLNQDTEMDSVFKWLSAGSADTEEWTTLLEGTCTEEDVLQYTIQDSDIGKYIKFTVTPKNEAENGEGNETSSNIVGPVTVSTIKPVISQAAVGGQMVGAQNLAGAAVGGEAEAVYTYTHQYGIEEDTNATKFQWYRSTTPNGQLEPIEGATGKTYTVQTEDRSKYIKVGITPAAIDGTIGDEVITDGMLVKWKLSFNDEFNYEAKNGYDPQVTEKWRVTQEIRPIGSPTIYQIRIPDNLEFTGGKLIIHNRKEHLDTLGDGTSTAELDKKMGRPHEWTTGNLISKEAYGPEGYYEASYKYAFTTGLNQSFWAMAEKMSGKGGLELDFNEGHFPREVKSNLHYFNESGGRVMNSIGHYPIGSNNFSDWSEPNLASAFHKYGGYYEQVDPSAPWDQGVNADNYRVFFDDKQLRSTRGSQWESDPLLIYFSIAIYPGFGGPWNDAIDGSQMEVDYVRFYELLPVTKDDLQQGILTAQELVDNAVVGTEAGNYPQSAVNALIPIIESAETVFDKENPTQDEINHALNSVNEGIAAFKAKQVGDRSEVSGLIGEAEKLLERYPEGSGFLQCMSGIYNGLKEAADLAKVTVNSPYPTQAELDEKIEPLETMLARFMNGVNFSGTASSNQTIDLRETARAADFTVPAEYTPEILLPDTAKAEIKITRQLSKEISVKITIPKEAELRGEFKLPKDAEAASEEWTIENSIEMGGVKSSKPVRIELNGKNDSKIGVIRRTGENSGIIEEITKTIREDSQGAAEAALNEATKVVRVEGSLVLYTLETEDYAVYRTKETESPSPTPSATPDDNHNNNNNNSWNPGGNLTPGIWLPSGNETTA